ncbi:MAG: HNH endonuclease [Anaerolineae bacterium]|nr:HNH endonuclease [Gloeobacterales cyanobacterium ES-bin-313]
MTSYIPVSLRQQVVHRAEEKYEYCRIHQNFSTYTHEIDHVLAVKHGGETISENLVLSCLPCNRRKGSDLTSIDPFTGEITPLFNPRLQTWTDHFTLVDDHILGITPSGRTTVFLLKFNEPTRLQIRQVLISQKLYP